MSSFFKEEYAAALKEQEELDRLMLRVKADLSVLDTLSLEELLKVNRYFDQLSRDYEMEIARLTDQCPDE